MPQVEGERSAVLEFAKKHDFVGSVKAPIRLLTLSWTSSVSFRMWRLASMHLEIRSSRASSAPIGRA